MFMMVVGKMIIIIIKITRLPARYIAEAGRGRAGGAVW